MKVEMQLSGVEGVIATLQSLPAEVVSKRGGPVKTALRKGALVILAAEKANLRAVMGHQVGAQHVESTGLLLANLIASRGRPPSDGKGERYLVRVKRKTYTRRGSRPVTTLKSAQLLEHGSSHQPAEPWIRPAFLANAEKAINVVTTELLKGIDSVVNKLAAQNK